MKGSKRQQIARVLLVILGVQFLLPLLLFVSVQTVRQAQLKQIRENYLEPSFFEKITLSRTQFEKLQFIDDKEILYEGNMYDVHSIKQENDQFTLLVLSDKTETKLKEITKKLAETDQHSKANLLMSMSGFLYYQEKPMLFTAVTSEKVSYNKLILQKPANRFLSVETPPPDRIS